MDWFRSWHGAPTDPKWLLIAKRSETQAGFVSAIVWALLDHASQNTDDRGNVDKFDTETYAAFSGFEEDVIKRVIDCLKEKSLIVDGHLSAWDKRQPKREDNSTERVQKHRNAKKQTETHGNAREEKSREDKKDTEANASGDLPEKVSAKAKPARGTRVDPNWKPSEPDRAFAKQLGFSENEIDREAAQFRDYWTGVPASKGVKTDWPATWRNRLRDRAERLGKRPASQPELKLPPNWDLTMRAYTGDNPGRRGSWVWGGAEPGYPGCHVPPEIQRKHGFEPAAERVA